FGYSLLLPAMQSALQLTLAQAGALGSANTGGYLVGAVISHKVLAAVGYRRGFYAALLLQGVALLLMGLAPSIGVMVVLRAVQGVLGAFVFVGGAALLLASGGRAGALGAYFGGVGGGIALSVLILPLAADWRLGWLALGTLSLLMAATSLLPVRSLREPAPPVLGRGGSLAPIALAMLVYALYGAGYIGYMTFVTSGVSGSLLLFWLVLGLATLFNGAVWGWVVARWGGAAGIRLSMVLLVIASLEPLLRAAPLLSAALFGVSFLGVITAITDLFRLKLPPGAWPRAMALSTAVFALGQALGPGVAGLIGDLTAGVSGSLWAATTLLAAGLGASLLPLGRSDRGRGVGGAG
ncbi:MAG: YbfB/YjiJ family MFS transporter, partial [Trueperaceae bacterium]